MQGWSVALDGYAAPPARGTACRRKYDGEEAKHNCRDTLQQVRFTANLL